MQTKRMLVIIPARGGSKGIKGKNITDLCGKPLIQYTIEPALQLLHDKKVDTVIVSTDSEEIAAISKALGAEAPFIRPPHLAADTSKSVDLILHAIDYYEQNNLTFDSVMLLQPTSPLRNDKDMSAVVDLWNDLSQSNDSLISVYKEEYVCDLVMYNKEGDVGIPLNDGHNKGIRRQEHTETYIRNGAFYVTKVGYIKHTQQIISDNPILYEMSKHRSVNLDTKEDLEFLRWLICR